MFDTSIKTPKTPITRRIGYLFVACIMIAAVFWLISTIANLILHTITPQGQPEVTEQPYLPLNQAIEVVIEVDEGHGTSEDQ